MTLKINVSEVVHIKDLLIGAAKRYFAAVKTFFTHVPEKFKAIAAIFVKSNGNKAPPVGKKKGGQK